MIAHTYLFHSLHPDLFSQCREHPHNVRFWLNGRLLCDKRFLPTDIGNITLPVPEDVDLKLQAGTARFHVESEFLDVFHKRPDGSDYTIRTLSVDGRFHED